MGAARPLHGILITVLVSGLVGQPSFDAEMQSVQSRLDSILGAADGETTRAVAPPAALHARHLAFKRKAHRRPHLVAAAVATNVASKATEGGLLAAVSSSNSAASVARSSSEGASGVAEELSGGSSTSESSDIEAAILHQENSGLKQQLKELQAKAQAGRHFEAQLSEALRSRDSLLHRSEFLMRKHMLVLDHLDEEKKSAQKQDKLLKDENGKLQKELATEAEEVLLAKAKTTAAEVHLRASQADAAELKAELQAQQKSASQARSSYEAAEAQDRLDLANSDARATKLQTSLDAMQSQLAGTMVSNTRLQTSATALAAGLKTTQAKLGQTAQLRTQAEQNAKRNMAQYSKSLLQLQVAQQDSKTQQAREQTELQRESSLAASLNQARSYVGQREREVKELQQEIADRALMQQQVNEQRAVNGAPPMQQVNVWGNLLQPAAQPNMEMLQPPL